MRDRVLFYSLRRLVFLVFVLLGTTFLAFFLTRLLPGNPIARVASPYASKAAKQAMMHAAHLDLPFFNQFYLYVVQVLHGNLGTSYTTARPVVADLAQRFPGSFELVFYGMILTIALAIPLGISSAVNRDGIWDHVGRVISVVGVSIPVFWLGIVLLQIFFAALGWLPGPEGRLAVSMSAPPHITGMYTVDAALTGNWATFWDAVRHLILPVFVLAFTGIAPLARVTRSAMIEALESDYVRAARSLGISQRTILWRHALKNAAIPILTITAAVFGFSLGGSVLVEAVFAWPGIGQYAYQAILGSDFPAIQGFILIDTTFYVLVYLILDIAIAMIDPRVDFSHG